MKVAVIDLPPLDKTIDSITVSVEDGFIEAAFDITGSDTVDLTFPTMYLYVGTAGDVKVDLIKGGTVVFKNLQAGRFHKICAKRVYVAGTTALNLVGAYHAV